MCQVEPRRALGPHYNGQDPVFGSGGISMEYVIQS